MTFDSLLDITAGIALVLGAFLSLAAGAGLLRFPDVLSRMHAATKPQILGLLLVVIAVALAARSWSTLLVLTPVVVFQLVTAPISAHMIGRAAHRSDNVDHASMLIDEMEEAEGLPEHPDVLPHDPDALGGEERQSP
ncbi:monovalent cation/H(+) antiporter subunit G [Lysobacter korlensis]|uniref:Monovalent cation/H(+) antiporter subunit G n=1 Tax=Lysobacter korlensis TaxID=553636 RepID=A0ABV6RWJ2_9GAMM